MRVLFISNLFPDTSAPVRGLDNATLLHALRAHSGCEIQVLSPRPTLVPGWRRQDRWKARAEDRNILPTYVPNLYVPRLGSCWNDRLLVEALHRPFADCLATFHPDAVLASWLFPDGCAVAALCRENRIPLVLVTQGSDTHQYLGIPRRRRKILAAIESSEAVICRSGDLARRLEATGVPREKLRVIYNGVNTSVFTRRSREEARTTLGLDPEEASLLFVGNLLPVKDPLFLLRAHALLNQRRHEEGLRPARLRLIGEGPLEGAIRQESVHLGTSGQVELLGKKRPEEVALWMNASDGFCLSSVNEGFPNVLLEAMACGLPIVSTDVGGIGERVKSAKEGHLVPPGHLEAYVNALAVVLSTRSASPPPPVPSWKEAASAYHQTLVEAFGSAPCEGRRSG